MTTTPVTTPATSESLLAANALAAVVHKAAAAAVRNALDAKTGLPSAWAAFDLASKDLAATAARVIHLAPVGATVHTPEALIVAQRDDLAWTDYFPHGFAREVVLTQDGAHARRHLADECEDSGTGWIRFERYVVDATLASHGYVDKVSRKIVQEG